jgi:hypothetical protein
MSILRLKVNFTPGVSYRIRDRHMMEYAGGGCSVRDSAEVESSDRNCIPLRLTLCGRILRLAFKAPGPAL